MKLHDYIQTFPALIEEDCKELIDIFNDNEDKHIVNKNKVQNFTELNLNEVRPDLAHNLAMKAYKAIDMYFDIWCPIGDHFFPETFGFEEFRIKRYNKGQAFKRHVDVGDYKSARRFMAFLFYLNDDFEDGGTLFRTPETKYIKPETGNVLMFPPTWQYPHEGMKVKKGTKYIMSTYLHYV